MSHAHTLIRTAATTALTGLTTTASRVYANRMHPMADANLPGLRVFLNDENVEIVSIHTPMTQQRTVQLVVECCASANTALDSTCDTMQGEVETALASGLSVDGKTLEPVLAGSRYDFEQGSPAVGVKRVVFTIDFFTLANAPDNLV